MPYSDLVTQKEAAAILNRSVSAVSRAIRDGRLTYADSERRLLHRPGLEARFRQTTRPRIDAPQRKAQKLEPPASKPRRTAASYWPRLAQKLEIVLAGAPYYWAREPNPAQLQLFCRTLDELRSQVEAEGLEP